MHISVAQETINKLLPNLKILEKELKKKSKEFQNIVKIGRTHLQDATPLSLGQEFSGYQIQLKKCIERIEYALKEIYYLGPRWHSCWNWNKFKKGF
jgi:fumarate hydratase class II